MNPEQQRIAIAEACGEDNDSIVRELTAVTEQRDEARADAEKAKAYKKVLKTTNANLKCERDEAVNNYETAQLLSVRVGEQRDRLAKALKLVAEGSLCCACRGSAELVSIAEAALQSLTPNEP